MVWLIPRPIYKTNWNAKCEFQQLLQHPKNRLTLSTDEMVLSEDTNNFINTSDSTLLLEAINFD